MNDKFIVIKRSDIDKYLTDMSKGIFDYHLQEIEIGRMNDNKTLFNFYLVVNQDEPYADEVIEIMKRHGHWEVE